jgi:hypothetical protein
MNDQDLTKTDYDPDSSLVLIEGLSHFLTNFLQNLASCQTSFRLIKIFEVKFIIIIIIIIHCPTNESNYGAGNFTAFSNQLKISLFIIVLRLIIISAKVKTSKHSFWV